jgi:cobalt-zinc-cadmium efflux system outer membrane protein
MKKVVWPHLILGLLLSSGPLLAAVPPPERPVLSDLVRQALAGNPRLEAAVQRARAAEKAVPQAGAPPDPQLSFGLMNVPISSFSFEQEPMTGKLISLMQRFPFPGKLALSESMARSEAAAVGFQREEVRNQVVQAVKKAYYDLYLVDRARETVERNKALMEQIVQVAETKYATGSGLQQDVLRAQVELSKLDDDLLMWRERRQAVTARLNALLDRPPASPLGPTSPDLDLPSADPRLLTPEEVEARRPLLLAWKERLGKSETAVRLARRGEWPDFTVGAGYTQRDNLSNGMFGHDFVTATISLNIPLFFKRKQGARVAEKELDRLAVAAEAADARAVVLAEVESSRAALDRNRQRVELYRGGILLQARQSLQSAEAGYEVGKVDFLTLLNNWMLVQNYELQYFSALADYQKALADYELATGSGNKE